MPNAVRFVVRWLVAAAAAVGGRWRGAGVEAERVRAENSLPRFLGKAQDTLHRKRQHNFLIKLKSVARS